jgi:hypothetical protein
MLARKVAALVAVCALGAGIVAAPAFSWDNPPPPPQTKSKCNSGNGNGSDAITFVVGAHCYGGDPGKSFVAGNKGGDEIPTSGGVPNPGGNNVP